METYGIVVEVWDSNLKDHGSNPTWSILKKMFYLFYHIYHNFTILHWNKDTRLWFWKIKFFFPSAAWRIRTGDLQGGVDVIRSQTSKCSPRHYLSVCEWLEHNILMQHMDCEIILEAGPASINPLSCSVYDYFLIQCICIADIFFVGSIYRKMILQ